MRTRQFALRSPLNSRLVIDLRQVPGKNGGMIVLLAAMIVFLFLALGSFAFLACILIPPGRKYALSTALWFAAWGPCCVSLLVLAMLGLVAGGIAVQTTKIHWEDAPRLFSAVGWGSAVVAGIVTCFVASAAAWLHQAIIHRFTFMLFRLYATFVVAGIGSVFGILIVLLVMVWQPSPQAEWVAVFSIPILMTVFGAIAYKRARGLRGNAPTRFTWITPEEFRGPEKSEK